MSYPRVLTRARQILNRTTLNTSAVVWRRVQVADTSGGFTDSYVVAGTYPCSFSAYQITPVERENSITVIQVSAWTFVFPYGTEIHNTDRLVCNQRTFEVTAAGNGSIEIGKRILAAEII